MKSFDLKLKITAVVLSLAAAYTAGRYTAGPIVKVDTTRLTDTVKDTDVTKITVVNEPPNGAKTTTTTEHITTTTERTTKTKSDTVTTPQKARYNIAVLGQVNYNKGLSDQDYGLSVSKEVFANITAGIYAMNNGTIGLSLGFNF